MKKIISDLKKEHNTTIKGLTNELNLFYILNLFNTTKRDCLIVTNSLYDATKLYNKLLTYKEVLLYPQDDNVNLLNYLESPELKFTRLETLKKIKEEKNIIVTNLTGYLKKLPLKEKEKLIKLNVNSVINRNELIKELINLGYKKETITAKTGEFSTRGLIIDIFPIYENNPIRIRLDENKIESIKYYSEIDQLTFENTESVEISNINEKESNLNSSIVDYLTKPIVVFLDYENFKTLPQDDNFHDLNSIKNDHVIYMHPYNIKYKKLFDASPITNYNENYELLKRDYDKLKENKKIFFYLKNNQNKEKVLKQIPEALIVDKKLNEGFIFNNYIVISDNDLKEEKRSEINYRSKYKFGFKIKNYTDINKGDYVVHTSHGIGIYQGIVELKQDNVLKDYLLIKYANNDNIYISVENINNIYKYSDQEGKKPKINSLSNNTWLKTTASVKSKIEDITEELIELYEQRINIKNKPYKIYEEEEIFASSIDFVLTKDQLTAIKDIQKDLVKDYPMDRLLCGDVGFGKTEVANRAMFTTVLNNDQVMYLCPTTILSMQQYEKALDRFKDWPIKIELLNRFVSPKKQKEIIKEFKEGKVDILFGTHRLLSKDIEFKSLGLLVVDEEQRFGVKHKEKIKELKVDVNVLTLSATPIPRTLQMSLSGLRDLTLIETPPLNRYPIQTYVLEEDEEVIKNAIYKELSREGQTFILFNNIEKIEKIAFNIKKLVPDAKVAFAHGRMNKLEIETIMNDFKNNLLDVLVSTTIIENGIDIPNANTLIIYNADNFGLSQLYQIRGRIGRSNKVAYSYLMYRRNKIVSEEAEKRLKAIEEFTELGSGYDIALRDLSIRGAGDIFGKSQSGFVDKVGMNYYLKLMNDNLNTKKGIDETEEEVNKTSLNISTHIHDEFVEEEELKIYVHNLINKIQNETTYNNVLKELTDRFGKVNDQIKGYMLKTWFDSLANYFDIQIVSNSEIIINNLNTFITEEKEYSVSVRRTQTIIKRNKTSSETDYLKRLVKTLTKIKKNKNL